MFRKTVRITTIWQNSDNATKMIFIVGLMIYRILESILNSSYVLILRKSKKYIKSRMDILGSMKDIPLVLK